MHAFFSCAGVNNWYRSNRSNTYITNVPCSYSASASRVISMYNWCDSLHLFSGPPRLASLTLISSCTCVSSWVHTFHPQNICITWDQVCDLCTHCRLLYIWCYNNIFTSPSFMDSWRFKM